MAVQLVTNIKQFVGLAADAKPTDAAVLVGSRFLELDTATEYVWDGAAWRSLGAGTGYAVNTELPAAAALADGASSTPTTPTVGAELLGTDVSTNTQLDRVRTTNLNQATVGTAGSNPGALVIVALSMAHDGSNTWNRLRAGSLSSDNATAPGGGGLWTNTSVRLVNPSGSMDRAVSAASSGAGLGVQKVHPQNEQNNVLQASGAQTASGTGSVVTGLGGYRMMTVMLDVTVAGSVAGDLLNVYVQYSPDAGTTWDDLISFTQVLGNGGAKQFLAHVNADLGTPPAMAAPKDATLAAGTANSAVDFGDRLRVKWVIVNGGGTHSFTFAVKASFK
jgi:hypothetical protein